MDSPPSKKASQQLKPWWSGRSGRFEPIFPDGPALALTRTHVALQEKSNELEFLDASYKRAQKAWNDEKSCLEEQIRNLRSEASRNEQNFRVATLNNLCAGTGTSCRTADHKVFWSLYNETL